MANIKPLNNKELAFFCGQMATIVQSGISSLEAAGIMQEDAAQDDIIILSEIENDMKQSGSLAHAVAKTKAFPNYCTQMISVGESTGNLDTILRDLAEYYAREDEIQTSIKNAILYPATMSSVILIIMFILLAKVMPIFETVFNQLGTELTGPAKLLLNIGIVLEKYTFVFMAVFAIGLLTALFCIKSPKAKSIREKFCKQNTFMREIQCKTSACHFANIMAIVLHSGIPADEGFLMADRVNTNTDFQNNLNICKSKMRDGISFGMALKQSGIFTGVYARMTTIGDRTGSLENTMTEIADMYEKDITEEIDGKIKMIEPLFVFILSIIIGIILLSVMIPLLSIISSL